jgi:uncharacterized damage-inducible protein DinB
MTLLDRLLGHDAWTTRQLLLASRGLTPAQLDAEFDVGHQSVRRTFLHVIWNMEAWTDQLAGRPLRAKPLDDGSLDTLLARLDRAADGLRGVAKAVEARNGWDELWRDRPDDPTSEKSYGGTIAHVITHSMHHRAQIIGMLHRLGVANVPEGDVLDWEFQTAEPGGK